jgi:hypothetical protein
LPDEVPALVSRGSEGLVEGQDEHSAGSPARCAAQDCAYLNGLLSFAVFRLEKNERGGRLWQRLDWLDLVP